MPKVDPARWLEARKEWETSLDVSYTDIAAKLGTSIPTVTLRAKREVWVKQDEVVDVQQINYSPRQLTELAMRALVRAALQTKDTASAVKAAGMLLDRTMGRVVATQDTPMLPADFDNDAQNWPDWLKARRLAYQEGRPLPDDGYGEPSQPLQEPFSDPDPAQTLPEPEKAPPASLGDPQPARLHLVDPAPPRFWSSPTRSDS